MRVRGVKIHAGGDDKLASPNSSMNIQRFKARFLRSNKLHCATPNYPLSPKLDAGRRLEMFI